MKKHEFTHKQSLINNVDAALKDLLMNGEPLSGQNVSVVFLRPTEDWLNRNNVTLPALNLYLYDIRENIKLRTSLDVARQYLPDAQGDKARASRIFRIDLCYLLTAWASSWDEEHFLLSAALEVLLKNLLLPNPRWPAENLPELLQNLPLPVQLEVAQGETISDIIDLWNLLKSETHTAIRLKATLAVETFEEEKVELVTTTQIKFQQELAELRGENAPGIDTVDLVPVRGRFRIVKNKDPKNTLAIEMSKLKMILKESGKEVKIREDGQFVIPRLKTGKYTLEICFDEKKTEQSIEVPSPGSGKPLVGFVFDICINESKELLCEQHKTSTS